MVRSRDGRHRYSRNSCQQAVLWAPASIMAQGGIPERRPLPTSQSLFQIWLGGLKTASGSFRDAIHPPTPLRPETSLLTPFIRGITVITVGHLYDNAAGRRNY